MKERQKAYKERDYKVGPSSKFHQGRVQMLLIMSDVPSMNPNFPTNEGSHQ